MLYIILPVHNRKQITAKFINQLKKQTFSEYHLILIDDGCQDDTDQMAQTELEPQQLTILYGNGQLWWAGSLQKAYQWIKKTKQGLLTQNSKDLVMIINDDVEFDPYFLENAVKQIQGCQKTLLCAQCFLPGSDEIDTGVLWNWWIGSLKKAQFDEEITCFSTRGLLLHLGDFLNLGGFYPKILPHYFSDYEFTIRAHQRGFKMITHPSVRLTTPLELSGTNEHQGTGFLDYMKKYFSKRHYRQPIYTFFFIFLACPHWGLKLRNWYFLSKEVIWHFKKALSTSAS